MNYDMKLSGERIRQLRKQKGYTQEKPAQALNIDRSFYSRIESGKTSCSVDSLVRLSELFDVSLDYLVLGEYSRMSTGGVERSLLKEDVQNLITHLKQFDANL